MSITSPRAVVLLALFSINLGNAPSQAAAPPDETKPGIVLPKDPKAVVLSFDPGAGGFVRKGQPPYIRIQADGQVTVTNLFDGSKKEAKLTPKEVEDLLRFAIKENDFFNVTAAKISDGIQEEVKRTGMAIALGGVGTSVIVVQANDKRHEVSYRGPAEYLRVYPKIKVLAQYVAVQNRLSDLGASIEKAK